MDTHKGLAPIVWVIIAAIVLGSGYVMYMHGGISYEKGDPIPPLLEESDVTRADWNTYEDIRFGFGFSYPPSWKLSVQGDGIVTLTGVSEQWPEDTITVTKVSGDSVTTNDAKFGSVSYFFDTSSKKWKRTGRTNERTGEKEHTVVTAEALFKTVGDLPVFFGTTRWKTEIVALSPSRFLIVSIGGSGNTSSLDPFVKTIRTVSPSSDWNTYHSEEYGFEFSYPRNWKVVDDFVVSKASPFERAEVKVLSPSRAADFRVVSQVDNPYFSEQIENAEQIFLGNIRAFQTRPFTPPNDYGVEEGDFLVTEIYAMNKYFYTLGYGIAIKGNDKSQEDTLLAKRILSTFKFTKPMELNKASEKELLDTAGWKMFRSSANFVFSYPPAFTLLEPRERLLVSLSSPACDFSISLDSLDTEIGGRAVRGEEWHASVKEEQVKVGDSSHAARLVYDKEERLQLMQVGGYIPGVFITMGTPSTNGLSNECIRQFYTILSTFVP